MDVSIGSPYTYILDTGGILVEYDTHARMTFQSWRLLQRRLCWISSGGTLERYDGEKEIPSH